MSFSEAQVHKPDEESPGSASSLAFGRWAFKHLVQMRATKWLGRLFRNDFKILLKFIQTTTCFLERFEYLLVGEGNFEGKRKLRLFYFSNHTSLLWPKVVSSWLGSRRKSCDLSNKYRIIALKCLHLGNFEAQRYTLRFSCFLPELQLS